MFYVLITVVSSQEYASGKTHQFYKLYKFTKWQRDLKKREGWEPRAPQIPREIQKRLIFLGGKVRGRLEADWTECQRAMVRNLPIHKLYSVVINLRPCEPCTHPAQKAFTFPSHLSLLIRLIFSKNYFLISLCPFCIHSMISTKSSILPFTASCCQQLYVLLGSDIITKCWQGSEEIEPSSTAGEAILKDNQVLKIQQVDP